MTEQEVIEQENEHEQKEIVEQKKMPKPKKIYGVMSCEIIKDDPSDTSSNWCSVCGYEGVMPMIMLKLRKGDLIWICYKCIQEMNKTLRGERNLSQGKFNLMASTINRLQKARGPIKVPRNSFDREKNQRLRKLSKKEKLQGR